MLPGKLIVEIKREGKWTVNSRTPLVTSQRRKDDKSRLLYTRPWAKSLKGMPVQTRSLLAVPVWPQKSPAIWRAMPSKVTVALPAPGRKFSPSEDGVHGQLGPHYEAGVALPLQDWWNQLPTSNKPARSLGQPRTSGACRSAESR